MQTETQMQAETQMQTETQTGALAPLPPELGDPVSSVQSALSSAGMASGQGWVLKMKVAAAIPTTADQVTISVLSS
eukprot:gene34411-20751_t